MKKLSPGVRLYAAIPLTENRSPSILVTVNDCPVSNGAGISDPLNVTVCQVSKPWFVKKRVAPPILLWAILSLTLTAVPA